MRLQQHEQCVGEGTGVRGGPSRGADYLERVVHAKGIWLFFQVNHLRDLGSEVT